MAFEPLSGEVRESAGVQDLVGREQHALRQEETAPAIPGPKAATGNPFEVQGREEGLGGFVASGDRRENARRPATGELPQRFLDERPRDALSPMGRFRRDEVDVPDRRGPVEDIRFEEAKDRRIILGDPDEIGVPPAAPCEVCVDAVERRASDPFDVGRIAWGRSPDLHTPDTGCGPRRLAL